MKDNDDLANKRLELDLEDSSILSIELPMGYNQTMSVETNMNNAAKQILIVASRYEQWIDGNVHHR